MDEHKALLRAMDKCNRNLRYKFDRELIHKGVDPNKYDIKLIGTLRNSKNVPIMSVEYDGFEEERGDSNEQ